MVTSSGRSRPQVITNESSSSCRFRKNNFVATEFELPLHPRHLSVSDFTYLLPPGRIAQHPLSQRDQAKLLSFHNGHITEDVFKNLARHLPEQAVLVFNDTKVIHARLLFRNENHAQIEVFLLEPMKPHMDMQLAMFTHGECTWRCFVGNARKWREKVLIRKFRKGEETGVLEASLDGMIDDDYLVRLKWTPQQFTLATMLQSAGYVPLPPYIKRHAEVADDNEYQTIYAVQDGSVAAPTAGLHFTEAVFDSLKSRNIGKLFSTLHVSAGTFLPVKSDKLEGHSMHHEQIVIHRALLEGLLHAVSTKKLIVAVGTTSMRTIESLFWLGLKAKSRTQWNHLEQWEPYELPEEGFSISDSLSALLEVMEKKKVNQFMAETSILIAPGYRFKLADGLITNFHLPQSTLLLLIAAFIGNDWKQVYEYALSHDFRFLSYGDASLHWRRRD